MYIIGIIDDKSSEVSDIQVAIAEAWNNANAIQDNVDFKEYTLQNEANVLEKLKAEILDDIQHQKIHCLIVDYKLDSIRQIITGNKIVDFVREKVREFPVVVLTNAPETSEQDDEIDPDKVYAKEFFLRANSTESRKMVYRIYRNIDRYLKERNSIERELKDAVDQYLQNNATESVDVELMVRISNLETERSKYLPTDQSTVEQTINPWALSDLKDLIDQIKQFNQS